MNPHTRRLPCGCRLTGGTAPAIDYCPMHEAAGVLADALAVAVADLDAIVAADPQPDPELLTHLVEHHAALAAAGRETTP